MDLAHKPSPLSPKVCSYLLCKVSGQRHQIAQDTYAEAAVTEEAAIRRQACGSEDAAAIKTMQKDVALMFIPRTLQQELGCNPSALKLYDYKNYALEFARR